jgi:hypothetical protein
MGTAVRCKLVSAGCLTCQNTLLPGILILRCMTSLCYRSVEKDNSFRLNALNHLADVNNITIFNFARIIHSSGCHVDLFDTFLKHDSVVTNGL